MGVLFLPAAIFLLESQFGCNGWKERAVCGILLSGTMEGRRDPEMNERKIAYYHLPGLFEF